ncbi:uncharacterized protein [Procambarus clarkii]|uniref:uncharacterized protein n=1 Tax=Procambarus clarkii TaxID=6728 RepID=UPI003743E308
MEHCGFVVASKTPITDKDARVGPGRRKKSGPISVVEPPVPALEVSLAPAYLSVAALAKVRSPVSAPPPPNVLVPRLSPPPPPPPPPPDPARPPLVCPAPFPPSLLSLPMTHNPDFADPDPNPELL